MLFVFYLIKILTVVFKCSFYCFVKNWIRLNCSNSITHCLMQVIKRSSLGDGGNVRILSDTWMSSLMLKSCAICDCSTSRTDTILFVIYTIKIYRNNTEMLLNMYVSVIRVSESTSTYWDPIYLNYPKKITFLLLVIMNKWN